MQAIFETAFDIFYLTTVILLGIRMIRKTDSRFFHLYGTMAVVLGCGDAFHLVPRAIALCTTGLASYTAALGIGKLITSVTMTVFYVVLYYIWQLRYQKKENRTLTLTVWILAAVRIILCLFPQNEWTSANPSLTWGILRNIPFAALGIVLIVLWYRTARSDSSYKYLWLAVTLSFGFYIPVVLWADTYPLVGVLMIPKTVAYLWIVWMGYSDMKKSMKEGESK